MTATPASLSASPSAVPLIRFLTSHLGGNSPCASCTRQSDPAPHGLPAHGLSSSFRAGGVPSGMVAFASLVRPDRSGETEETRRRSPADALDAVARQVAQLGPPALPQAMAQPPPVPLPISPAQGPVRTSVEDLLPGLVRRVAWSGDGRRGTIRLEIGAGALEGATLLVQTDDQRVSIHLNAPSGVDVHEWRARIGRRLAAKGLSVDLLEVW